MVLGFCLLLFPEAPQKIFLPYWENTFKTRFRSETTVFVLPIETEWGHHSQPSGVVLSTFLTVTCTERLTAYPSERRPWQGTWRELTITGFLRVGLRWFYLPNASPKQFPGTSCFLGSSKRVSIKWSVLSDCFPRWKFDCYPLQRGLRVLDFG